MVAVALANGEVLVHRLAYGERLRGFGVHADDAERTCFGKRFHSPLQRLRRARARVPVAALWLALRRNLLDFFIELFIFLAIVRRTFGRTIGVDAYGVHGAIYSDTIGQFADGLDRIFRAEIDDFRALILRHFQTRGDRIDSDDATSAEQFAACDHELADRAAAKNSDR